MADEQVEILRAIWNEMKTLNSRTDRVREELKAEIGTLRVEFKSEIGTLREELKSEIDGLRQETHRGFELLSGRIDNLLTGEHGREHTDLRERVRRIESHLGFGPSHA